MKRIITIITALLAVLAMACTEPEVICQHVGSNGVCTFTSDALYASTCVVVKLRRVRTDYKPNEKLHESMEEFLAGPPLEERVCSGIMLGGKQVERRFLFASPGNMDEATTHCSFSRWYTGRDKDVNATVVIDGAMVGVSKYIDESSTKIKQARRYARIFNETGELTGDIADEFLAGEQWMRDLTMKIAMMIDGEAMTKCEMQIMPDDGGAP